MPQHELTTENFDGFYRRNFDLVYRTCFAYMKNKADAEDLTSDVFVKALSGHFIFNDLSHERKWLVTVSINLCKDRLKSWWKKKTSAIDDDVFEIGKNDKKDELLELILKLSPKYKDVIILHYYMGYKTDEVAAILKKPSSTVRNNLKEAREILKKDLEK